MGFIKEEDMKKLGRIICVFFMIASVFATFSGCDLPSNQNDDGICEVTVINGTGGGKYDIGESVTITAIVGSDQLFSEWSFSDGSTSTYNPCTFVITSTTDIMAVANFIDHIHNYTVETTAATCTEKGKSVYTCEDCGHTYEVEIPATGHSWTGWEVVYDKTCTIDGLKRRTCTNCGAIEEAAITHLGHTVTNWVTIQEPTCTVAGIKKGGCSVCHEEVEAEIPALNHTFTSVVTAPTCTEQGYTTYTCTVCGFVVVSNYTNALGHTWGEWTVTSEPTYTQNGERSRTCSVCDETETEVIPSLLTLVENTGGESYSITGANGTLFTAGSPNILLPTEYNGKAVTTIGEGAFDNTVLSGATLIIPSSITTVSDDAFGSGATTVVIESTEVAASTSNDLLSAAQFVYILDTITEVDTAITDGFDLQAESDKEGYNMYIPKA